MNTKSRSRPYVSNGTSPMGITAGDLAPPPSTIAAQIVHNRSTVSRQEPENKALFGKLLQEYLKDPVIEDSNVETNAQLIGVVAEAGLDVLLSEDPFAPAELLQQASDSLLVIKLTIARKPDVLLYQGEKSDQERPPLCLWLLAKVLNLLGRRNKLALQNDLSKLLLAMLDSLCGSTKTWKQGIAFQSLLKDIIEDALQLLEENELIDDGTAKSNATIPSAGRMASMWPSCRDLLVLPPGYQAHINDSVQAQFVVVQLLSLFAGGLSGQEQDEESLPVPNPDLAIFQFEAWAFDCIYRILDSCSSTPEVTANDCDMVFASLCHLLRAILVNRCPRRKITPIADLTAALLQNLRPTDHPEFSIAIEIFLDELIYNCQPNTKRLTCCRELLEPLLKDLLNENDTILEQNIKNIFAAHIAHLVSMAETVGRFAPHPPKRQRLDVSPLNVWQELYDKQVRSIQGLLPAWHGPVFEDVDLSAVEHFMKLPYESRIYLLEAIGILPCIATTSTNIDNDLKGCQICDSGSFKQRLEHGIWTEKNDNTPQYRPLLLFLSLLIEDSGFRRSKRLRILATHAIRRLSNHMNDTECSNITWGGVGAWLMRSLQSSLRELRIAAAVALVSFLREDLAEPIRVRNRLDTLDFLKALTEKNSLPNQDTLIFTWGLVGKTCGDAELNLALIQLVDYLGHSHSLLAGAAYHELLDLASWANCTPLELLKPYWSSLATHVVKDTINCPQKIQQLSDLLGLSVNELLLLTQTDTIPYLVLTRKKDVVQRIAQARGPGIAIQDLWLQPSRNLAAVLALLLVQQSEDPERDAILLLRDAAPSFAEMDLSALVKVDPILIACEILKRAADCSDAKKIQAQQGLRLLAAINERKTGQTKSRSSKFLSLFLEAHILGIMSYFTDIVDALVDRQSYAEKKRALRAVEQLIVVGKSHVGIAIPQIRATLQSAFKAAPLIDTAFSAWSALMSAAIEEEVESLLDHTFAIIARYWNKFTPESQTCAYDLVQVMLSTHNDLIRDRVEMIPALPDIEMLQKFHNDIERLKGAIEPMILFEAFARRCSDENAVIVQTALIDLVPFLEVNQKYIHESAVSQQPSPIIATLSRSLLDAVVRFKESDPTIPELAAKCLGMIGSIDPNRVDKARDKHEILMLSNFDKAYEVIDFVATMLETVLVDAFHSAPTGRTQTYLAYTMQELLKFCGFRTVLYRSKSSQSGPTYQRWNQIPESVRSTLTPFFNTKYVLVHPSMPADGNRLPIFRVGMLHGTWLRTIVFNLLHKAKGENAQMVFPVLSRVIWGHDISIATFLLPFVVLNIVVGGSEDDVEAINSEFLNVLNIDIENADASTVEEVKQCSEVLDYLSRWLQEKRKLLNEYATSHSRSHNLPDDFDELRETAQISSVETVLSAIPADILSRRAVQCRSFARALFHWEQHIRQTLEKSKSMKQPVDMDDPFRHLQDIYAQIEEPDAVEGMSTMLHILDPEQQVLEHKRAGRWTAAQSWYDLSLLEKPQDQSLQVELLGCLRASNRYGPLLDTALSITTSQPTALATILPFAAEASWVTSKWDALERFVASDSLTKGNDFNTEVGKALLALKQRDSDRFYSLLTSLRMGVASSLSTAATASLASAHPYTIKLHALYELEQIGGLKTMSISPDQLVERLNRRLDILGAFTVDKQYLLGIRRAAMELSNLPFSKQQIGAAWLTSARLSRKAGLRDAAYDAMLHATRLQDGAAKIEHSRLLWQDGHHRKAIQNLQSAIESNVFQSYTTSTLDNQTGTTDGDIVIGRVQNYLVGKTQLLLAKWMDRAGHSKSEDLRAHYLQACRSFARWEKGHYYMGKHYLKIFESEKALPRQKQTESYLCADVQKLVIDNFLRSMVYGAKYYYETVPKILTLWLDVAAEIHNAERKPRELDHQHHANKVRKLEAMHKQLKKYIDRLPAYIFYTALPQMTSRINHPHPKASEILLHTITRVVSSHPQHTLWSILAVAKAKATDKSSKAAVVLNQLKRVGKDSSGLDLKILITHGEKLTTALLAACEVATDSRASRASLSRDLSFNHKLAPCQLVVPVEKVLTATLPTAMGGPVIRNHKAFSRTPVTISSFQDDVLVLSSLQRPKKLVMRGSDGELYGLLCKPKDDLRKDQRLMEFTTMIDRGLKRDVESSKRRLYIRTYAVTPLNEECGAIEWVDGLKPMRDIILASYRNKGLRPDYGELRQQLDRACADPEKGTWKIFSDQIVPKFPAVLHEWFIDTFPEPESWFTARLRYTRSCAVMSVVGNALGLGDRHGENILLEEGNGGCFHVDFNCLFDKGLTFEKPELVPFRLTHNMIDAFGVYGYEGPFRTAAELTLKILRQYEDTLMTIMETFVYDPTTDFIAKPKKKTPNVPETPAEVLDSVRAKINGLLAGETVPLSVDGYVDALIKMAVDPRRLCGMYIGWCAFF